MRSIVSGTEPRLKNERAASCQSLVWMTRFQFAFILFHSLAHVGEAHFTDSIRGLKA